MLGTTNIKHLHTVASCWILLIHPKGRIFIQFDIWVFLENLWRKFDGRHNPTRITGTLGEGLCAFIIIISNWIFLRMQNISNKFVENFKKHFIYSKIFFRKFCLLWGNVEKYCTFGQATGENITWSMRFACRVTKTTDTNSEYVILIAFPQQQWLLEIASVFLGTFLLSLSLSYPVTSCLSTRSLHLLYFYYFAISLP